MGVWQTSPPWTEFLTHTCENITFPQLRLRTVKTGTSNVVAVRLIAETETNLLNALRDHSPQKKVRRMFQFPKKDQLPETSFIFRWFIFTLSGQFKNINDNYESINDSINNHCETLMTIMKVLMTVLTTLVKHFDLSESLVRTL